MSVELISILLGLFTGLILGLTGAGGALLAIPLLTLCLNLSIYQAAPIALLAVFIGASIGAAQGLYKGIVRYKAAMLIATVGVILAPLGVMAAKQIPNQMLSILLIGTLLFIGIRTWKTALLKALDNSHKAPAACMINPTTSKLFWTASCTKRLLTTGIFAGFLSGLLGVGGGFLIAPSLNKVSNFNNQTVIATTLAAVTLIAISSIASHLQASIINWHIAIPFAVAVALSTFVSGEVLGDRIPKHISQKGFALLCFIAAVYLIIERLN